MLNEFLILLMALLTCLNIWLKYQKNYWNRMNVPNIKGSLIFGNISDIFLYRNNPAECLQKLYNNQNTEYEPIVGIHLFNEPSLLVRDCDLIKKILIKDFRKFPNRFSQADVKNDVLGSHNLFFMKNPNWKKLRNKLTPIFSSGKMKQMFYLVDEIGNQLNEHLCNLTNESVNGSGVTKELKELCALYTTDVIASVALGIQSNTMQNPNGEFRSNGRTLFNFTWWRSFEFNTIFFFPKLASIFRCKLFSKAVTNMLRTSVNYVISERKKLNEPLTPRNDLIDILMMAENESKLSENVEMKFEGDMLIAQVASFFSAGFETTSATISFVLYELSKNVDVQTKLKNEINNILKGNNGKLTYDSVNEMVYLNMIVQETLRMYPPLPFLDRECILGMNESDYSLEPFSDFKIPHGMPILIPCYAIHRDPKNFIDPNTFNPDRFHPSKRNEYKNAYMPFGLGPHNCIGERFGLIQVKVGIVNFLKNHSVRSCQKSHNSIKYNPRALLMQADEGIYCDIVRDCLI